MTFEQYAGPEPEADAVCAGVWRLMRKAWDAAVSATREEDRNAVCEHCREGRASFDRGHAWVHEWRDGPYGYYNVFCKATPIRKLP